MHFKKKPMQQLKFILLFVLSIPIFSNAQSTKKELLVLDYLTVNGSMGQYNFAYDQLLEMLTTRYPETTANAQQWKFLKENKSKALQEMKSLLVPVYDANFTQTEITKMLAFYKSETGKQLLADRSVMTADQKEVLNTFYNSEVGKNIIEKQAVLGGAISKVSEQWSRDLYETALSLLK